ncbi:hypothetical protein FQN54_004186 [Arachnomyces sp. PD_36]|nr:hypothetical protein FQN54_004186 [Arachnomyces sp. PD_36]
MPSDLQVFVKWKEQTVFAGEDVECTITFKNVAADEVHEPSQTPQQHQRGNASRSVNGSANGDYFSSKAISRFLPNNRRSFPLRPQGRPQPPAGRTHKVSSSLSTPIAPSQGFPPLPLPSEKGQGYQPGHKHKRSVSIISLDNDGKERKPGQPQFNTQVPARGHGRSASLQVFSKRNDNYREGPQTAHRFPMRPGPPTGSLSSGNIKGDLERRRSPNSPHSGLPSPSTPGGASRPLHTQRSLPLPTDFKFPAAPPPPNDSNNNSLSTSPAATPGNDAPASAIPHRPNPRDVPTLEAPHHLAPAKVLSNISINGSTRSSNEFYSLSNNSTETLESEYVSYPNRPHQPMRNRRHPSGFDNYGKGSELQSLLMGYAQINASFTVDGSLVNQSSFEEVKRQGVVGGHGGAPNSPQKQQSGGGLWGSLGWNSIGESLGGLLSNGELSGLQNMRGVSSSKSIPLLSTPQSLLFVDMRLAPGEERSFSFSFTLPQGLPASHKGKAIKVTYNLVIGTQRANRPKEMQQVHRVNVPFRVFSGVNSQGEILGHDLMSPYVLLRDEARVQKVGSTPGTIKEKNMSRSSLASGPEFLSYVDDILGHGIRHDASNSLYSTTPLQKEISVESTSGAPSCKDAIDLAILRSNQSSTANMSANRFEINRNARRIATVVLNRPSHRLGETVIAMVDFSNAALPCYSLRGTLETSEKVTPGLALRSSTSISRATRRVHASYFENTLFSSRVVFSPSIPVSATPTILTSGVNLEWELRFEFVTTSFHAEDEIGPSGVNLLEVVGQDDRGTVLASLEHLSSTSFEVVIPLTVYGETVREPVSEELQGFSI